MPVSEDRLVEFCTAVPVPRYVPYSSPEVTPCGSEAFRYCEAYLAMAGAHHRGEEVAEGVAAVESLDLMRQTICGWTLAAGGCATLELTSCWHAFWGGWTTPRCSHNEVWGSRRWCSPSREWTGR